MAQAARARRSNEKAAETRAHVQPKPAKVACAPPAATVILGIIFFASDAPPSFEAVTDRRFRSARLEKARQVILQNDVVPTEPGESVITDEHSPLAPMELPSADEHAAAMKKLCLWKHLGHSA